MLYLNNKYSRKWYSIGIHNCFSHRLSICFRGDKMLAFDDFASFDLILVCFGYSREFLTPSTISLFMFERPLHSQNKYGSDTASRCPRQTAVEEEEKKTEEKTGERENLWE